jgi:hypothetical protein
MLNMSRSYACGTVPAVKLHIMTVEATAERLVPAPPAAVAAGMIAGAMRKALGEDLERLAALVSERGEASV